MCAVVGSRARWEESARAPIWTGPSTDSPGWTCFRGDHHVPNLLNHGSDTSSVRHAREQAGRFQAARPRQDGLTGGCGLAWQAGQVVGRKGGRVPSMEEE